MKSTFLCIIGLFALFSRGWAVGGSTPFANLMPEPRLDPPNYMVAILHNGQPICGGSFMKQDTIVTAATCVYGKANLAVAVSIPNPTNDEKHPVSTVLVHPYFRKSKLDYNVAVLKIPRVDNVDILDLPKSEPTAGESLVRSFWDPEKIDLGFQSEITSTVDRNACKKYLEKYLTITGKLICVSKSDRKLHLIDGSPLAILDEVNGGKILHGIGTYFVRETDDNLPDVYVSVANSEINSFLKMFA